MLLHELNMRECTLVADTGHCPLPVTPLCHCATACFTLVAAWGPGVDSGQDFSERGAYQVRLGT